MTNDTNDNLPTLEQVDQFLMLKDLLASIYLEMKEFSKKKPDEPLNKFKVKNINRVLGPIKAILASQPTLEFLDLMDDDVLPSNSDAILVIGQFTASMDRFEKKYFKYNSRTGKHEWKTVQKSNH
ncbi:MAG: hypothetical protein JWP94_2979 [Mucilaginibacter sp.]|nr:hypothetical protein [Mucilaginibacter sp.]